jgi:hypothetical protein
MSSARACLGSVLLVAALSGCGRPPSPPPQPQPAPPATVAQPSAPQPQPTPAVGGMGNDLETPPAITDADIPPMPETPFAAARPPEIVRAVYTFAAKHPEVLSKVPCFCGCERRGHRHNDDCFVAARDAQGRPTVWEPHGVG